VSARRDSNEKNRALAAEPNRVEGFSLCGLDRCSLEGAKGMPADELRRLLEVNLRFLKRRLSTIGGDWNAFE